MQAAIGVGQLEKLPGFVARRRENFDGLKTGLQAEGFEEHFVFPEATENSEPSWFGFPLTIRQGSPLKRREVVTYLEDHRVGTRLLFGGNLTRQPAFKDVNYRVVGGLATTDEIMENTFWVGVWPGIGPDERQYMLETFGSMIRTLLP